MKDDYTINSYYLTYTSLFKRVDGCTFLNSGVKGLTSSLTPAIYAVPCDMEVLALNVE